MANIIGTNGNDTLVGSSEADTIKDLAGNDITGNQSNDTLASEGGNDQFVYSDYYDGIDLVRYFVLMQIIELRNWEARNSR